MTTATDSALDARRMRTVVWVVALATVGLIFDGYDLVVYGTVVSTFLRDPSHIGNVTPAIAGVLGSYALVGVLVGALLAGTVGDILGRRKVMLFAYAWFSIGMAITALSGTTMMFGWMRFFTGLGVSLGHPAWNATYEGTHDIHALIRGRAITGSGFHFAAEAFSKMVAERDFAAIARAAQASLDNAATLEAFARSARLGHAVDLG
jgi:MFS family permease